MTSPEPTTAERLAAALRAANEEWEKFQNSISAELDPDAERAARVLWERTTGQKWSPGADDGPGPTLVATAREWLLLFQAAGLAVVDQSSDAERVVLAGPLRALAVEWVRASRRLRDAGGDAAVAAVFEQHGELLLEFLGEEDARERLRAERQGGEPR